MPITRTTLLSGPATATFAGHTFFARDGILVSPALELAEVDSDAQGVLDATVSGQPVTIRFTPTAPFADLVALYPYLDGAPGTPLFGATDEPLVLVAANGVRLTFAAAAITQMPDLLLSSRGTVAGTVTFLAIGARNAPITTTNRLVTIDTTSAPDWTSASPAQLADDFAITWGGAPWLELRSRDGVQVRFAMKTEPVLSSANGLLDLTLESLTVEARFTPASPVGPAESDLLAALQLQGAGATPGRLISANAETLRIAGEHLWVELPLAQVTQGELAFDTAHGRIGELVFRSTRAAVGAVMTVEALAALNEGPSQ